LKHEEKKKGFQPKKAQRGIAATQKYISRNGAKSQRNIYPQISRWPQNVSFRKMIRNVLAINRL